MSKYPYVGDQYKPLLGQQYIQTNPVSYNHNLQQLPQYQQYQQHQQYPQNNIVFLPGPSPAYNQKANQRPNHDSFAANEPNSNFLQSAKEASFRTPENQKQIIHKVEYGDTLEGLSLTYDVPISKLKQRNKIDDDSIYYLKEIIIPNPKASPLQLAKTQQFYIEEFKAHMPSEEKSEQAARYYLEQGEWNMDHALKLFKEDLEWELKNKMQFKSVPINQSNNAFNYSQQQLLNKKYL